MELLKTILLYLSMLYVSAVQGAPDPSTVTITPTPIPITPAVYASAALSTTPTPTPVPTPAITANPAYGALVLGDRNETVGKVQTRLQELGYYTGTIDNAYGNQTRKAVEEFQYQNGLTVDGIAGRYTQTILFESDSVVAAPVVTNTPAFYPDDTITPVPATQTPAPTETPQITATPEPEPTVSPDANTPATLDGYHFVMSGFETPVTLADTDTLLHPVEAEEALYIPLTEILKSAGNIIITNEDGTTEEIAFTVLADFYQVSYTQNDDGSVSNLVIEKNSQPQPMTLRNAIVLDGIFYLPLDDMQRMTGIAFAIDEESGTITITMPTAGT